MDTPDRSNSPRSSNARRTATTDELLAHAGWVRALSRVLVADPNAAEDIEQDAWVAALKRPPEAGDGLRAWWSRVVRNKASDARRANSRRQAREISAPLRNDVETPLEASSALEAQRELVSAIDALDEPLRATVIRRYVQGMSSPEIANLDGVSESTVRTRLQRALEALRGELDEKTPGGRAAWSALLISLARHEVPISAPTPTSASVAPTAVTVALGIVALVAVGVIGVRFANSREPEALTEVEIAHASEPEKTAALVAPLAESTQRAPIAETAVDSAAIAAVSTPAADARQLPAKLLEAPALPGFLTVRFLDASGRPIPGVDLVFTSRSGNGEIDVADAPRARSGADGRARLTVEREDLSFRRGRTASLPADVWEISLATSGLGWRQREISDKVQFGGTTDLGDVVLERGGRIRGRVLDEAGEPLAKAWVSVIEPEVLVEERKNARGGNFARNVTFGRAPTGADGAFELDGAPIGTYRVYARASDRSQAISEPFTLAAGGVLTVPDLICPENPFRITGHVFLPDGSLATQFDVEYRAVLPDGVVWFGGETRRDGSFTLVGTFDSTVTISAISKKPPTGELVVEGVLPGTKNLELRLPEPRSIEFAVRDPDGTPIEVYSVGIRDVEGGNSSSVGQAYPNGISSVNAPARPFEVFFAADGFLGEVLGPYTAKTAPARVEVVLRPALTVTGVVRAGDNPIPHAQVHLSRVLALPETGRNGFSTRFSDPIAEASANDQGRFLITTDERGSVVAWIVGDSGTWVTKPFELRASIDTIDIDVARGGRIEGRVLVPADRASERVVAFLSCGLPEAVRVNAGADGSFSAENLQPGTWSVIAEFPSGWHSDLSAYTPYDRHPALQTVSVSANTTSPCQIDLRSIEPREVSGRLRIDGAPQRNWIASLNWKGAQESDRRTSAVDSEGSFHIPAGSPGAFVLNVRATGEQQREDTIECALTLRHERMDWSLECACGSLEVAGPAGAHCAVVFDLAASGTWTTTVTLDESGRAFLDGLPSGRGRIHAVERPESATGLEITAGKAANARVP